VPPGAIHSPWHLPFIGASFRFVGNPGEWGMVARWLGRRRSDKQAAGALGESEKQAAHKHCTS